MPELKFLKTLIFPVGSLKVTKKQTLAFFLFKFFFCLHYQENDVYCLC